MFSTLRGSRLIRTALIATAAVGLGVTAAGAGIAAGTPSPNGLSESGPATVAPSLVATPGSELRFVSVAPCRIIDTRVAGGPVNNTTRTFSADGPNYSGQGGTATGCDIPTNVIAAVQLNLGAIPAAGQHGYVKAWATGQSEPLASLVNYTSSSAIANMVTVPVNSFSNFTVRTYHSAHIFADVAGYWVKPLYATVTSGGGIYAQRASGVVSVTRTGTGAYTIKFDRDVSRCSAQGTDLIFSGSRDVSVDNSGGSSGNVYVRVTDSSNALEDTYFHVSLTC